MLTMAVIHLSLDSIDPHVLQSSLSSLHAADLGLGLESLSRTLNSGSGLLG
jgi:hypothetical protein